MDNVAVDFQAIPNDEKLNFGRQKPTMSRVIPRSGGPAKKPRLQIDRQGVDHWLLYQDLFHTIIDMPTWRLVILIFFVYLCFNLTAALIFYGMSDDCGLELSTFREAAIFAVETTMTIGYGIRSNDPYWHECTGGWFVLLMVMVSCTVMDGLLLGLMYARISRADKRGVTVICSDKAVIRRIDGVPYFMIQVAEMRSHTLVEAHVRCYCINRISDQSAEMRAFPKVGTRNTGINRSSGSLGPATEMLKDSPVSSNYSTDVPVFIQQQNMRLQIPDDELGSMLFLGLPSLVVHRIDAWSPLTPKPSNQGRIGEKKRPKRDPRNSYKFPEILQRAGDVDAGEREGSIDNPHIKSGGRNDLTNEQIIRYMREMRTEIVAVVEGICPVTSNTAVKMKSYTVDDIVFDARFAACVIEDNEGRCKVDFSLFHDVIAVEKDPDRPEVQG